MNPLGDVLIFGLDGAARDCAGGVEAAGDIRIPDNIKLVIGVGRGRSDANSAPVWVEGDVLPGDAWIVMSNGEGSCVLLEDLQSPIIGYRTRTEIDPATCAIDTSSTSYM